MTIAAMDPRFEGTSYAEIDKVLTSLGFQPAIIYRAAGVNNVKVPNVNPQAATVIMWINNTGTTILQCGAERGDGTTPEDNTSVLFWQTASEDLQSQVADLIQRNRGTTAT